MRSIQGRWAKAWHGYLAHFWLNDRTTLCGKTHMLSHAGDSWTAAARATCRKCKKNYAARVAKQEKEATQ